MTREFSPAELESYLEETLSAEEMGTIEAALRTRPDLVQQLTVINARRNSGVHTLGEIWRRHRLSCPSREQLGSYLLGALDEAFSDYVRFHLEAVGCRLCRANLLDLQRRQTETDAAVSRRRKYFQSSAGYLRGPE